MTTMKEEARTIERKMASEQTTAELVNVLYWTKRNTASFEEIVTELLTRDDYRAEVNKYCADLEQQSVRFCFDLQDAADKLKDCNAAEIFVIGGQVVRETVRKYYPPDVTTCIYWTKNRMPEKWRDVQRHKVDVGGPKSAEELRQLLAAEFKDLVDQGLLKLPSPDRKMKEINPKSLPQRRQVASVPLLWRRRRVATVIFVPVESGSVSHRLGHARVISQKSAATSS